MHSCVSLRLVAAYKKIAPGINGDAGEGSIMRDRARFATCGCLVSDTFGNQRLDPGQSLDMP